MNVGGSALLPDALSTLMRERDDGVASVPHNVDCALVAARDAVLLAMSFHEV